VGEMRRVSGITLAIRVGLNSGEVVVRSIASDLHMDYYGRRANNSPRGQDGAGGGYRVQPC
jgi:class 3 adenylate cyclase